jgi:1-acyl-sn-glycerol-3-phosphate acyltransferase
VRVVCLNFSFYLLFLLCSLVVIPVLALYVTLVSLSGSRRKTLRQFRRAIAWYGTVVLHLPFPWVRVRAEHRRNGAEPGAAIYVCNHRSMSDPFLMACLYWMVSPIEVIQVVNVWPFRIPVLGMMARLAGYLSVNEMDTEDFFVRATEYLEDGVSIACFPEGTRSGGREMGQFHSSAFRLALRTGKPIVPVCITGNERIPPRGSLVLHPGTIRVRLLPPVTQDDYRDLTPFRLKSLVWQLIADETASMDTAADATPSC